MAASALLRSSLRSISSLSNAVRSRNADFHRITLPTTTPLRHGSYRSSPFVENLSGFTDYEVFRDPPEWRHVEAILPRKLVPEPTPKETYPSGWKPRDPESLELPYYVARSRNHMLPVYLKIGVRGTKRTTVIKNVRGDLGALHDELQKYLREKNGRPVPARINEIHCTLKIKGDYVLDAEDFLRSKGF